MSNSKKEEIYDNGAVLLLSAYDCFQTLYRLAAESVYINFSLVVHTIRGMRCIQMTTRMCIIQNIDFIRLEFHSHPTHISNFHKMKER